MLHPNWPSANFAYSQNVICNTAPTVSEDPASVPAKDKRISTGGMEMNRDNKMTVLLVEDEVLIAMTEKNGAGEIRLYCSTCYYR